SASSNDCFCGLSGSFRLPLLFLFTANQPRANRVDVAEPPPRARAAATDLDRVAAERVHDVEAVLVGDVVADKNGDATLEWRFGHELLHGLSLVPAARLELHDSLAQLNAIIWANFRLYGTHQAMYVGTECWLLAIVEGE